MSFNAEVFCIVILLFFVFSSALSLAALRLPERFSKLTLAAARSAIQTAAILGVISLGYLVYAFIADNFAVAAVAQYSATNLAIGYKISAVWAGASGSLLVWAVILFVLMAVWTNKAKDTPFDITALIIGSIVCAGFAAFLVFVAKPFAILSAAPSEGAGLNPLLLNFWMVIHPPLLFLGYSGFLVPFALILAAVFSGEFGSAEFHRTLRRWLLFAFCVLTLGIATGAKWAYVVLGWGGFWGWDPVENASLLPWLAALAALHSLAVTRRTGRYLVWTVALVGAPFLLCLVATFITRSNVLQSVHAFGENPMGSALLIMIGLTGGLWLVAVITAGLRIPARPAEAGQAGVPVGDRLAFITNMILIFTAASVAIGTFWPVLSRVLGQASVAPSRVFYDRISSAAGIALVALVIICTFVNWNRNRRVRAAGVIMAHLGLIVLAAAAGAGAFGEKETRLQLVKGKPQMAEGYEFTYTAFRDISARTKTGVGPEIVLRKGNSSMKLWPHRDVYADNQTTTEVALHSGLSEDIYLIFDGLNENNAVLLTVLFKPMMMWLWIAMLLIILGAGRMWFG